MKWLPVKDFEGLYEVSECGQVRSVDRKVLGRDGKTYPYKGKVISQNPNKNTSYYTCCLCKDNEQYTFLSHRLVCEAFHDNPDNKPEVNHKDGNRQNNLASNLEWVTRVENLRHAIDTGLRVYTNRLTYSEFVDCLMCVINGESYADLSQRVPYKIPFLSTKLRQIAKDLGIESDLDESLKLQKQQRARINGKKNR